VLSKDLTADVANQILCPDIILARPIRSSGSSQSISHQLLLLLPSTSDGLVIVSGSFFLRLRMGSFRLGQGERLQCWCNVALVRDLAIHGQLLVCLLFKLEAQQEIMLAVAHVREST
jgi:hypothetical protein